MDGLIKSDLRNEMKNFKYIFVTIVFVSACGGGVKINKLSFIKRNRQLHKNLEVSIDASGVIEAISSVEIKSKGIW